MKSIRHLIILASIMLFASCSDGPYVNDYTTQRPKFTDIVGTYKFEEQSVTPDGVLEEYKKSRITLSPSGRYVLNHVADFSSDTTNKYEKNGWISFTGKWEMKVDTVEMASGEKKLHWGVVLDPEPGLPFIGFLGSSPPYKLILNYDDLDLGEVMIFSKK